MRITLHYGRQHLDLDRADDRPILTAPSPAALPDPAGAIRTALESPFDFPALRRALTPDDQIAVVLDENLPDLAGLLTPVLEHIASAGVPPESITLLCPPGRGSRTWPEHLPTRFRSVRVEVHDPTNRGHLAYLATTAAGKRIYLNRTLVESAQSVILTARRYDLLLGRAGAEGALFPALGDEETWQEMTGRVRFAPVEGEPWPTHRQAQEVAWLIGQPFYLQFIPGPGDTVAHVVAGANHASREAERLLDLCWRHAIPQRVDVVVATLRGEPQRHTFADLAAAVHTAARVVRPEGRIALLTGAAPPPAPGFEVLRQEDDPREALQELQKKPTLERAAAIQWTQAACHARLAVLSGLEADLVEELYATPLGGPPDVQRLLSGRESCLLLEDAHRRLVTVG
jgi:hypothetical protein